MFRQCSDTRSNFDGMREKMARVFLGEKWVEDFVTDIHMNDLANHDVLLGINEYQDPVDTLKSGGIPKLRRFECFQWHTLQMESHLLRDIGRQTQFAYRKSLFASRPIYRG